MAEIPLPILSGTASPTQRVGPAQEAPFLATAAPVTFGDGFYEKELEGTDRFRWMSQRGRLTFVPHPAERFLELCLFCEFGDLSQHLTASAGKHHENLRLVHGWAPVSLTVPSQADHLVLEASRLFPKAYYPSDSRSLAFRVRGAFLHEDPERHARMRQQWANAVLNTQEMLQGNTILDSTPPSLGIDLHGACNVKPPCVYCEWDLSKEQEGEDTDTVFTVDTLREYGEFFSNAAKLVNCSIGEPFMMKTLDELLDVFGDQGKMLEMSTNGQILTDRNIQKLLGRNIHLYVSLDSATAETYARLRNDTFEKILHNIRRLVGAKGGYGNLPKVFLVFMPMRANVHELDAFVQLCADLGVDRLVLRPLNDTPGNNLNWTRGGYHFEYEKELLPFGELVRISGRAAELCSRLGVDLCDQLDFGGALETTVEDEFSAGRQGVATVNLAPVGSTISTRTAPTWAAIGDSGEAPGAEVTDPVEPVDSQTDEKPPLGLEKWPLCPEPWRDLYILRRGIRPCGYGGAPVGAVDGYREVWNSPLLQDIRDNLRHGTFHQYCLQSPACPIVRKSEHVHRLPVRQRAYLWVWRSWQLVNTVTGGIPRSVLQRLRSARAAGSSLLRRLP